MTRITFPIFLSFPLLFSVFLSSTLVSSVPLEDRDASYTIDLNPYPNKPKLTFNSQGQFKITVFSDQHYGENAWDVWGPEQDANSTELTETVLPSEKPDYVVINGDLITGENTFKENSTDYVNILLAPIIQAQIPFSTTQGNHDNQVNITHLAEIKRELSIAPLSYTRVAPNGVGGDPEMGPGTYWVPVYNTTNDTEPALVLWFFDSRGGFGPGPSADSNPNPDWVDATVATWINKTKEAMDETWGEAGTVGRGSLAFVHIPPHAIQAVQESLNTTDGLNADTLGSGSTEATTDDANIGKDDPFYTAVTAIPNLHALISGHDHGNEWCAREPTRNTVFCFDKHAGYGGYSSDGWGYGIRNVLFTSGSVHEPPQSWIRMQNGTIIAPVTLGSGFSG
ncbi:Metallo-dependent phosphatase [Stereum hirsutum FP-91666 SS1]|uniref:Metallo-dependent phosphatase n=1 Tax=Stereum hirsutum (strain FP-91666) TaxID=721885 RepID=UPI00044494A5|nr:Metallo-dependent phosphatase [Stereum hirsutum FP-91666 SS1]EIM80979.1 Metallo-dependent phosphatase [Stereum hirsutum FP-91666 SS1]